jgi:hypothetical protein
MAEFKQGDKVRWKSHGGTAEGKVVDVRTSDFTLDGQQFRASKDEPKFIVESESGSGKAAHNASALSKA